MYAALIGGIMVDLKESQGGTWAQNRYPGVRCDIPSHSYRKQVPNEVRSFS